LDNAFRIAVMTHPQPVPITPRNRSFARNAASRRWWMNDDPVATAWFTALSMTFPRGEAFFIESVKPFRDQVPEELQGRIKAFIQQEVLHSREHLAFNRLIEQSGYDTTRIDAGVAAKIDQARGAPPVVQLAITVALEHFTAIMAHDALEHIGEFDGLDPQVRQLWIWHAMEEIEHKSVAFDTLMAATTRTSGLRRWLLRSMTMLNVSWNFLRHRLRDMGDLYEQDGIRSWSTWLRTARYLLLFPGPLRRVFPAWLSYFRPSFHPWDEDDRALLARGESVIGEPVSA
jgi:uncharacterized protein